MKFTLRSLFEYAEWANRRLIAGLKAQPDPPDAQVRETLFHILKSAEIWLARIRGEDTSATPSRREDPSLAECEDLSEEVARQYQAYLKVLPDADVETVVCYRNIEGKEYRARIGDILAQVVLHGSYHRGQIAQAIRRAGGKPVVTDYIAFAHENES